MAVEEKLHSGVKWRKRINCCASSQYGSLSKTCCRLRRVILRRNSMQRVEKNNSDIGRPGSLSHSKGRGKNRLRKKKFIKKSVAAPSRKALWSSS